MVSRYGEDTLRHLISYDSSVQLARDRGLKLRQSVGGAKSSQLHNTHDQPFTGILHFLDEQRLEQADMNQQVLFFLIEHKQDIFSFLSSIRGTSDLPGTKYDAAHGCIKTRQLLYSIVVKL